MLIQKCLTEDLGYEIDEALKETLLELSKNNISLNNKEIVILPNITRKVKEIGYIPADEKIHFITADIYLKVIKKYIMIDEKNNIIIGYSFKHSQ